MGTLKNNLELTSLFSVIIVLALLGVLAHYCDTKNKPKIRKRVEELYMNGNFAIGTVSTVAGDLSGPTTLRLGNIYYNFESPTGIIHASLSGLLPRQISAATDSLFKRRVSIGIKSDDKFLVLYDKNDPNNAILLLDHPIKSDSDFVRYKVEIEEKRKDKSWRGYE